MEIQIRRWKAALRLAGFAAVVACPPPCVARVPDLPAHEPQLRWNVPQFAAVGDSAVLRDGIVVALEQDEFGMLWIASSEGLIRFDGYHFKRVAITPQGEDTGVNGFVASVRSDRKGRLWVGMGGGGLFMLDQRNGQWHAWRPDPLQPDALPAGTISSIEVDGGGVAWVALSIGGIARVDPVTGRIGRFTRENGKLDDNRVRHLSIDRDNVLWFGDQAGGLWRWPAGVARPQPVTADPRTWERIRKYAVTMLRQGPDGRMWAGFVNGDLLRVDRETGAIGWLRGGGPDGPVQAGATIYDLAVAGEDRVWTGAKDGVDIWRPSDGRWLGHIGTNRRQTVSALQTTEACAVLRDESGAIWIGGYGGQLQRHVPPVPGVAVHRTDDDADGDFADASVNSILALKNGGLWLGSRAHGIGVLDAQLRLVRSFRLPRDASAPAQQETEPVAGMAYGGDGRIWVGAGSRLVAVDEQGNPQFSVAIGSSPVRRVYASRDGFIWTATQDGAVRTDVRTRKAARLLLADGTPLRGFVDTFLEDNDGVVWVGTQAGAGLLRYDAASGRCVEPVVLLDGVRRRPEVKGLLVDGQGRFWMDTNIGLYLLRSRTQDRMAFSSVNIGPMLRGRAFGANLLMDRDGRLWTQRGVIDPRAQGNYMFHPADGVDIGVGWFRAYDQMADGRMVFGGTKGVLLADPAQFAPWRFAARPLLSEIVAAGRQVAVGAVGAGLVLPADAPHLSVEFSSTDMTAPEQLLYRFRLEGYDAGWRETGATRRQAVYTNLAPGAYRFTVETSNRAGNWFGPATSFTVTVAPHWWQAWWGRALLAAAMMLAMAGVVRWRTGLLRHRQALLEQRVRERTAELEAVSQSLAEKSAALEQASITDPLTGLQNRRFLTGRIEQDVALCIRQHAGGAAPEDACLIFFLVDIDHFKQVNDQLGHMAGDAVLRQMRERLQSCFRDSDYLVRWGGEEFLVVARQTRRDAACELAERLRVAVADLPFTLPDGGPLAKTCSIGYACFPLAPHLPEALSWEGTVELADAALYVVKRNGRNGWLGAVSASDPDMAALRGHAGGPLHAWESAGTLRLAGWRELVETELAVQ